MSRRPAFAPSWDDDLGPAPAVDNDPTPTPEGEGLDDAVRGTWGPAQYRANRHHDCAGTDPFCPGEICPGELYTRTAVLDRIRGRRGPGRRGTVIVTRTCQACTP